MTICCAPLVPESVDAGHWNRVGGWVQSNASSENNWMQPSASFETSAGSNADSALVVSTVSLTSPPLVVTSHTSTLVESQGSVLSAPMSSPPAGSEASAMSASQVSKKASPSWVALSVVW